MAKKLRMLGSLKDNEAVKSVNGALPDEKGNINVPDPDWNTLKNRPFGDESVVLVDWGGDSSKVETVTVDNNGEIVPVLFKVSEYVPYTADEINNMQTNNPATIEATGAYDYVTFDGADGSGTYATCDVFAWTVSYNDGGKSTVMGFNSERGGEDLSQLFGLQILIPSGGVWMFSPYTEFILTRCAFESIKTIDPQFLPEAVQPVPSTTETWTFTLEDGTEVTKKVVVSE